MKYALDYIQNLTPYNPPINERHNYQGCLLDFNERTIPINQKIKKALINFIEQEKIEAYPEYFELTQKIADYCKVNKDQVLLANGSDQGIDIVIRTFTEKKDSVIIPAPSFAMFFQLALVNDNQIHKPLYAQDLSFPLQETMALLDQKIKLLIICNPNNPTGTLVALPDLETILKKALQKQTIVLIDEAYFEFSQVTACSLLDKYPNLIISRTFSKAFGLAGLRIAYLLTNPTNIKEMLKVRGPYDINILATVGATAALAALPEAESYANEVMQQAKPLVENFFRQNNIYFYESQANFILFNTENPKEKQKILAQNGFRLRLLHQPRLENTLRITVGTIKQMKSFINMYTKLFIKE
ncbi:MAG: histidinol-phosphate transaminase [Candidatus Margulisiibacteriota bacterium]|jgi:histidinol-phosphate aminotransferase